MMDTEQIFNVLDKMLMSSLSKENDMGLANGKMGSCLYFYIMGRKSNNTLYTNVANDLLDSLFENIDTLFSLDFKKGLIGVGLGITCLIKRGYVQGNLNHILSDIDDYLFKYLSTDQYKNQNDLSFFIHTIYYCTIRLKEQKKGSESEYLLKEIIIQLINDLYKKLDHAFFAEPLIYTTDYLVPKLLFLLSILYEQKFYNNRILKLIEELSYIVLTSFPILHTNRLYLLWGMDRVNNLIGNLHWEKQILLLYGNISLRVILTQELKDKNVFFNKGLVSIYCLFTALKKFYSDAEISDYQAEIKKRIISSSVWNLLLNDEKYFNVYKGLYDGYCSIPLIIK